MARAAVAGAQTAGGSWIWEDLRKEARKLESEVDIKLSLYAKLGSNFGGDSPQSATAAQSREAEVRAREIEELLQRLAGVNTAMADCIAGGASDVLTHTLARHRDILREFTQEFRRTRTTVSASRQHAELLGAFGRHKDSGGYRDDDSLDSQQALLREHRQIHSASSQLDNVLGQANATMGALQQQRNLYGDINSKLSGLGAQFPIVNQLLSNIRKKKNKDTMIITCVVTACTLFVLIYWINKK